LRLQPARNATAKSSGMNVFLTRNLCDPLMQFP
jgi:hypothetical protein